jgi:hypothetical protein
MFRKIATAMALCLGLGAFAPAQAAVIKPVMSDGSWYLTVEGAIDITDGIVMSGYAKAFKAKGITDVTVILNSPGGNVLGGRGVAVTIWNNDWATVIPADTTCASMCADIWLAGSTRYAYPTSRIGTHSAGLKVGKAGNVRVKRADNSDRIKFFRTIGLSEVAISSMLAPNPDDMLWLSPSKAADLGIKYTVLGAPKPVTPSPALVTAPAQPATVLAAPVAPAPVEEAPASCSGTSRDPETGKLKWTC